MAREFVLAWQRFRRAEKARLFRIETNFAMYRDLGRLLRALEMAPDNRSPYFIVESPFLTHEQYCAAAVERVRSDYVLVRDGFASDSVALESLRKPEPDAAEKPEDALADVFNEIWQQVKGRLEFLTLILLPTKLSDTAQWALTVERLIDVFENSGIRLAAADPTQTSLSELCRRREKTVLSSRFLVSTETVQNYLLQVAAGGWEALDAPGGKAATPAIGTSETSSSGNNSTAAKSEQPSGYLSQELSVQFRTLMASAAKGAAEGKCDAAIAALEKARVICRQNRLLTEEAIVLLAIGNNYLAAGKSAKALDTYFESAATAQGVAAMSVSLQARLAAGSTLLRMEQYERAARVYELAAEDARVADVQIMRIEALRLAGTCHNLDGRSEDAIRCWREALAGSQTMTPIERGHSTLEQLGEDFARFYSDRGLTDQARSIQDQVAGMKKAIGSVGG